MALIVAGLKLDADSRLAALLFAVPALQERGLARIEATSGDGVRTGRRHLAAQPHATDHARLRRAFGGQRREEPQEMKAQIEVLRKMLLAMVEDIRVVLLRLASRTQTLRYYAASPTSCACRWRARRSNSIRRWPTASASGS
jgi:GTP pyrophosphokinase